MLLFARSPRRQVGDARIYFFTAYTLSFRALVEKSPAKETGTNVHVTRRSEGEPPYLTAVAHRREIPRKRNENKRTRYAA